MSALKHEVENAVALAAAHGLAIKVETVSFNDMGLDYRVGFATAADGRRWVLRLPRRADVVQQAKSEARVLELLQTRLPITVPDWQICSDTLIAYPLLPGGPGLTFDPITFDTTWHFDKSSKAYTESLGGTLAALHAINAKDATEAGMPELVPAMVRQKWLTDLDQVAANFDVPHNLLSALWAWIEEDSYWPDFSVPIHGDLYAGHIMVGPDGEVVGIIDWTEARIADPAVDFVGHLKLFDEGSLGVLLNAYEAAGGQLWPRVVEHCRLLNRATPVVYAAYSLKVRDSEHIAVAQSQLLFAAKPER